MKELWVEKYRPKTVDGYVFRDEAQRNQVNTWIKEKTIPHLLFSGNAGIGKTTLAKLLFHELEVNDLDILEINASRTNSVDDVRDKIVNFVQMIPFGDFKVVLLDEADYLSTNAQAALRGVMEEYHTTARFILTCNYPNKIIPALHSRCQGFHIAKVDITEFTARVATILVDENVYSFHQDLQSTKPRMKNTHRIPVTDSSIERSMIDENTKKGWEHYVRHLENSASSREIEKKLKSQKGLVGHII